MLRDKNYFDGKLFVFTNEETKKLALKFAKDSQLPLYLVVDDAIRKHLKENGLTLEGKPKRPTLV